MSQMREKDVFLVLEKSKMDKRHEILPTLVPRI